MAQYETEEEQINAIKEWWKENGRSVIAGVVIGVAGLVGWKGWNNYQETQALEASDIYFDMRSSIVTQNQQAIVEQANILKESYSGTPYGAMGALILAKAKADEGDHEATIDNLQWVIENGKEENIKSVAKLRLARVYIATDALNEAESLLDESFPFAFNSLLMEVRGDLYSQRGDIEAARDAYDAAIASAGEQSITYLKMKRDNLGNNS